ncbi:MAG: CRISPR-associated protein Cas4, partial [Candidatus Omnitrophica bacterium]|nr:CRISPR-associated protein Cas4 [Candidatus Omnitrophota bacterium]
LFTAEGRVMHERVDAGENSYRPGVKTTRSVPLRSLELGISGIADVVEWHGKGSDVLPFPVEYKRGKPKAHDADNIQLCLQALCLEEMLHCRIERGALFYGKTWHRHDVSFDGALRQKTIQAVKDTHRMFGSGITPLPEPGPKCKHCSLAEQCMPGTISKKKAPELYLNKLYKSISEDTM